MSARTFSIRAATVVSALLLLIVSGCGGSSNTAPNPNPNPGGPTANVSIVAGAMSLGASAYAPNPISVAAGTTVIWKNNDSMTHTVTSNTSGQFDMTISAGGTASHLFSTAGSFPYHCAIAGHNMTGTVTVTP